MSVIHAWPQSPPCEKHPNICDRLKFRAFVGVIEGASIYRRHEADVLNTHVMGWIRQLEILGGVEQSWWLPPTRAAICVCLLACEGRIWRDGKAMKLMLEHIGGLLQVLYISFLCAVIVKSLLCSALLFTHWLGLGLKFGVGLRLGFGLWLLFTTSWLGLGSA